MNAKTTDYFHQSLISLYKEMIQEVILECELEARSRLDEPVLKRKFKNIISSAELEGLTTVEISYLIDEAMNEWEAKHRVIA